MNATYDLEILKLAQMEMEIKQSIRRSLLGIAPAQPTDAWVQLVAKHEAAGLSRVKAIEAAAKERPELYAAQSAPKPQPEAPTPPPADPRWTALVAKHQARGLSKAQAIVAAAKADPELYAAQLR